MSPIKHIRKNLFDVSQAVFGEIAGTTQASVSRWETGEQTPSHTEMLRIREEAKRRGLDWNDLWFFETPPSSTEAA
jgi:transcriptional regulator with XRE-family HTH domain